ncbi:transcription initiation factor-like protein iib [Sporormia fimetaria CBS 119925]|uniref:Transcription initiation factor IIB n=1 Tax=Sporormia fimetaria CBS 119925 TaxID=1340428 RepID=A0A6A6VDY5_9PLEO|nr:transcription initiation factor-like protein iib [Sporormia fimetaria CBS 119925]
MAPNYAPDGRQLSPGEVFEEVKPQIGAQEWREDLSVTLICPDCREDPPNIVEEYSAGDTVCASCGLVLQERMIDTRSEWRTFSNDDQGNDDPSRVGDAANPLLHGSQLQTEIGFGDGNLRARDLARAQNKNNYDKTNKALMQAYSQIASLCDSASCGSSVADAAKHIYKMADDAKIFKGKSQDAIIAGCIFIACRQMGVPRSFREIFRLTHVSKKEIGRTFKALEAFVQGEEKKSNGTIKKPTKSTEANQLISRACDRLQLDRGLSIIAEEAAKRVTDLGVAAGRSPLSITGAVIYLISHLMGAARSPKEIAGTVEVSDGTIRTAYKLIYQALDKIIDEDWIKKGGDKSKVPQP